MVLKRPWDQKRMFWAFGKGNFQFFCSFWVTKLKPFSGKVRQIVQNYLNQNLVIRSFLENGFKVILNSKTNVLSVWKRHFSAFLQIFDWWVETVFWERETVLWKVFAQVCFVWGFLENTFQSLLDHSRHSLLEFLNISNVLNVSIWIFNWS